MIHKTLSLCSLTVVLSCNVIIPMQPGSTQTSSSSSLFSSRSSTSDSAVTDFHSAAAARSAANTPVESQRIPQPPLPSGAIGELLHTGPMLQSMENPTINGDLRNQMDWARGIADGAAQATNFLGRGNPAANMQEGIL